MVKKRNVKKKKEGIFRESWEYLKDTRKHIYWIIGIFVFFSLFGYIYSGELGFLDETLKELVEKIEGKGPWELVWFIFQNNVSSAFVAMILGALVGIMPVVSALMNGTLLGYVYAKASAVEGFGVIVLLIPHGIFELPAIFVALGLGLRLGGFVFARGNKKEEFMQRLRGGLKVFFTIVLPLLIIAAIIEGLLIGLG